MSDVAREIMEFVKLKDRPSTFELEVMGRNSRTRKLLGITAPVQEGKRVWVVKKPSTKESNSWQVSYSEPNLDVVATLVKGQITSRMEFLVLRLRQLGSPLGESPACQWEIDVGDASKHKERCEVISDALRTLLVE